MWAVDFAWVMRIVVNLSLLNQGKIDSCNNLLCVHCNVFSSQILFYNRDMEKFFVSNLRILRYQKAFDFLFVPKYFFG